MSDRDWWRGAALYQVYLRSFQDSDGDGIGDLQGLAARLDYVASLGVDGLWITPFFESPMRDFGYDVSDHHAVAPEYGTLEDFDRVVARAHELGLKVIVDQVWNHTALEHRWFQQSRSSRDNARADWYVWADARPDGSPPTNWQAWMGGPTWSWEPRRRQYYLHNFLPQMPDLNFHCPAVQDAVLGTARFWLERGVDGLRLDAANNYFHDPVLADNPALPPGEAGEQPVLMQRHVHNANRPETPAFLERVRALLDEFPSRMSVAEVGGMDGLPVMVDYSRGPRRLHTAYSFALLGDRQGPEFLADCLGRWAAPEARESWPSWAMSNHDAPRVASRWRGTPSLHLALLAALRGTIFLYQGEELGLGQTELRHDELRDPYGLANWPLHAGRDGCRTPMPWAADAPNAGFTTGTPWLRCDAAHRALAVDLQHGDPDSTLNFARRLLALRRRSAALRVGDLAVDHAGDDLLVLGRSAGDERLWLAFNLGSVARRLEAPAGSPMPLLAVGGAVLDGGAVVLPAYSALYAQLTSHGGTPA